jgi:hypothetical protein
MLTFKKIEDELAVRVGQDPARPHQLILKAQSEMGKLSESYQLFERGESGSSQYHLENMEHSCAETLLALMEFCVRQELDFTGAVEHIWQKRKMKLWADKPSGPAPTIESN